MFSTLFEEFSQFGVQKKEPVPFFDQVVDAASKNDLKTIEELFEKHQIKDGNIGEGGGITIEYLLVSCISSSVSTEIIDFLIKKGADVNRKSYFGGSPLNKAISCDNFPVVILLVQSGAVIEEDTSSPPLHSAATIFNSYNDRHSGKKNIMILKWLIEEAKADVNFLGSSGISALISLMTSDAADLTIVEYLLRSGADIFKTIIQIRVVPSSYQTNNIMDPLPSFIGNNWYINQAFSRDAVKSVMLSAVGLCFEKLMHEKERNHIDKIEKYQSMFSCLLNASKRAIIEKVAHLKNEGKRDFKIRWLISELAGNFEYTEELTEILMRKAYPSADEIKGFKESQMILTCRFVYETIDEIEKAEKKSPLLIFSQDPSLDKNIRTKMLPMIFDFAGLKPEKVKPTQ